MVRMLIISAFIVALSGCMANKQTTTQVPETVVEKRYELLLKFATLEDIKRVPYRLANLKMEILEDVSSTDHIYRVSIVSKDYAIDGTLEKMNADDGISWVKRQD